MEFDAEAEARLVQGLRRGEEEAYATLVRQYGGRMLAVARRMLRNEEDAREVVQEAYLSAFRGLESFEGSARLSTWLHRIVVNAALMKLRTRRRKPEESIDDFLPRYLEDGHQATPTPRWKLSSQQLLESRELRQAVRDSIDRLPDGYRTVLVLRDLEELDTKETADLLGVSTNVVKTRLHRARQALRELIEPQVLEMQS